MTDTALLIFYLRPARARARATAEAEALSLLRNLGAQLARGGPLSERGGVFWMSLPSASVDRATERLPLLGYTEAVDFAERVPDGEASRNDVVLWRRRPHRLLRLYEESPEAAREQAPDRRVFALETKAGDVRPVRGYRGDSRPLSRRGLPAYDARMLVSIAAGAGGRMFLDPFAGCRVISCDVDPSLRHGLTSLGAAHVVADARRLPFASATFDAVATDPPYEHEAAETVVEAAREAARVLRAGGRLAMLSAAWQGDGLRRAVTALGLALLHEEAIDRKGVECAVLVWERG
jgi:SAM-dependent methyltransferase